MRALLESQADVAVVVGGYNSSNTSHLVELCEGKVPAYYVKDADEILSRDSIRHLDLHKGVVVSHNWLPDKPKVEVLVSAGASCPDAMVEAVLARIAGFFPGARDLRQAADAYAHLQRNAAPST
jgi:4-hydroxy-3-methylbut-2-enyl diphosphate reductase